jgi:protein-S-isoprenylcysteine O-methyltransferase Ste14
MWMQLFRRTLKASLIGLVGFGLVVFVPAGTLDYWQGWAFLAVFGVSSTIVGIYLGLTDPALLERRLRVGPAAETRPAQKVIIAVSFVLFLALLAGSAFDHRLGWSHVPALASVLGNTLVALGMAIDLRVFRENSYGASTIRMMEGQRVITTGPYALVRHPMYVGALILVFGIPPALGSWWGLFIALAMIPFLMLRIGDEERMLRDELEGYKAYTRRVRYRLIPGLW